jgi:hypothetical protein
MPIGNKFGTNAAKQIWAITYFTSVLHFQFSSIAASFIALFQAVSALTIAYLFFSWTKK